MALKLQITIICSPYNNCSKIICSRFKNWLDTFLLVFQEHIVCKGMNLIIILAKVWQNDL